MRGGRLLWQVLDLASGLPDGSMRLAVRPEEFALASSSIGALVERVLNYGASQRVVLCTNYGVEL